MKKILDTEELALENEFLLGQMTLREEVFKLLDAEGPLIDKIEFQKKLSKIKPLTRKDR